MKRALIIGKFYPPHLGHSYLIETAQRECEQVLVLVLGASHETIPAWLRADWIHAAHPTAHVVWETDDVPIDYDDPDIWDQHQAIINKVLEGGWYFPDRVYTSEPYGDELARRVTEFNAEHLSHGFPCEHRMVDVDRVHVPISATEIRNDTLGFWDKVIPAARPDLAQRVVIVGAESSGTSTLAADLADHYGSPLVLEYGRYFTEMARRSNDNWKSEDFNFIAKEQNRWEQQMAQYCLDQPLLICDTDITATAMFHEMYMGNGNPWVAAEATKLVPERMMYIITDHEDVPFEDDGFRVMEKRREEQTEWFKTNLSAAHAKYVLGPLRGNREERLAKAVERIDSYLPMAFKFAVPLEYQ